MGELIGKGAIGEVYKALDTETAKTVAVKQIDLNTISQEAIKSIEVEINLMKNLDHPNIVKYIEFIQTKTHLNIILEYVEGGSLHHIIKQNGMMGEHLVFIFVKQILDGLDYLHSQGIIHRDIKGANLLLTKNGVIKLADFGYSILVDKAKSNSIVGTCCWIAPEIIEQKGIISSACDIWSLGSTIIQLLTTKPPYYDYPFFGAMYRIVTDDCPPLPENISENLRDFLNKCFIKDPTMRPTAKDLLAHPWITSPNKKLVRKFINENENVGIPASLINEWKNNYRENLSSLTSSQNERGDRSSSKIEFEMKEFREEDIHIVKEDECNEKGTRECKQIRKERSKESEAIRKTASAEKKQAASKELSSPRLLPSKASIKTAIDTNKELLYKKPSHSNNTIYEVPSEYSQNFNHKVDKKGINANESSPNIIQTPSPSKLLQYSNISLKTLNIKGSAKKSYENIKLSQSIENHAYQNPKSLSFQDDNFVYKSKSTLSDGEQECGNNNNANTFNQERNELSCEIRVLIENLKSLREENIQRILEDSKVKKELSEMFKEKQLIIRKATKKDDQEGLTDMKNIIAYFNSSSTSDNELFLCIVKLSQIFTSKTSLIDYFLKHFGIVAYLNILNHSAINSRIVYVMLYTLNQLAQNNHCILEDLSCFQLFFHMSRYLHLFPEADIKIELTLMIFLILMNNQGLIKLFLSSGGFYLLPNLIDAAFVKNSELLLILSLDYFLFLFSKLESKCEDLALIFIQNKLLTRINIILLEIFSDENFVENENISLILERTLNLLIKLSEIKKREVILNDSIMKSIVSLLYSIPVMHILKVLKIFENLIRNPLNLNKLENIGYLECLLKLLNGYAFVDTDNESDKTFFKKVITAVLLQINAMIKHNSPRCEQLALLDGTQVLAHLAQCGQYTQELSPIISQLMNSTSLVAEKVKQSKVAELMQVPISSSKGDS